MRPEIHLPPEHPYGTNKRIRRHIFSDLQASLEHLRGRALQHAVGVRPSGKSEALKKRGRGAYDKAEELEPDKPSLIRLIASTSGTVCVQQEGGERAEISWLLRREGDF